MRDPILLKDLNNLKFSLNIIGYKKEGESIVFIVYENDIPVFSGVVDSYEYNDQNYTKQILKDNNIKKIDFLCWTHPHEDHTLGLDKILKTYVNKDTVIVLPELLYGSDDDMLDYTAQEKELFNEINSYLSGRSYNMSSIGVASGGANIVDKLVFKGINTKLALKITGVAPNSSLLRRRKENGNIKKNDLSIGLIIEFGGFKAFLGGDVEDQTIRLFDEEIFDNLNIIKIPHHSSKTSQFLPKLINNIDSTKNNRIACTTVSRKHNLPNEDVIDEYKRCVDFVFSTGNSNSKDDKLDYGLVNFKYTVNNSKIGFSKSENATLLYSSN